jgi:hypothetical protein
VEKPMEEESPLNGRSVTKGVDKKVDNKMQGMGR